MFLGFRISEVMESFIGNEGVVSYKSSGQEVTLLRANDVVNNRFHSVGYSLGDNFEHDVTEGYRAKVSRESWFFVLGNQAYEGVIIGFRVITFVENVKDRISNVTPYRVPIGLETLGTKPIRARGNISFELMSSLGI
jgi:hypothetical protein